MCSASRRGHGGIAGLCVPVRNKEDGHTAPQAGIFFDRNRLSSFNTMSSVWVQYQRQMSKHQNSFSTNQIELIVRCYCILAFDCHISGFGPSFCFNFSVASLNSFTISGDNLSLKLSVSGIDVIWIRMRPKS